MKFLNKEIEKITKNQVISGVKEGEKIVISNHFERLIFLSNNFVSAGKIKRGLEAFGKKVEILTNARENADENDKNLLPMIESINKYLAGQLDGLVVLPCSAIIKFDIQKLKPLHLQEGQEIDFENLPQILVDMGYERTSLVSQSGQFAVRGDIVDIFTTTFPHPIRVDFFGDEIENISFFDENDMKNIEKVEKIDIYAAKLPLGQDCLFDLEGTKFLDEPKRVNEEIEMLMQSYKTTSFFNNKFYQDFDNLLDKADFVFDNFNILNQGYCNQLVPTQSYLTDFMKLKQDIYDFRHMHQAIILFAGNERFKKNIESFLTENGFSYKDYQMGMPLENEVIYISPLAMPFSFSFLKEHVVAIGCDSLFRTQTSSFSKSKHSLFYLPKLGEYVVHTFHGIGKCIRIERLKISDVEKDYFVIEYKKGDILYLPSEEANTISAYVGSEEQPKLSALGGAEFNRLKDRVRASIKEMAISLVEIYKERQSAKGYAFSRDEALEKRFADGFGYPETPDQIKAIADIDRDMESSRLMERLICGDVGFGKTEVALRGAFKCIYNGKQVAFLCPTTILSEQHYRTAKERFAEFGVRVEVINRFRTASQVKDILSRLEEGRVDMIIGTHRLLSEDVKYKDLGLLILDEEQRFGVEHKEKIKDKSRTIDVLTLSATPIPRTLNMSLSGIRDISIIETPPRERLPIQTYVAEENDQLIKDVISRELARGGQAFIVYNRVESIEEFASYIRNLLPDAKVGVAHGQMSERVLEGVIARLYDGEYNILIATTLIENGINLPSANTMVVIDSDRLGLSQLYQIRGRIGRSDKLSYAYLTYHKDKVLTPEAYKRLEAIKEFSQLGSGFKIAMRDLELRGAGNIFGKEQHGHIAKVGYDMFVKLLDEQVKEIKGEKIKKRSNVKLEINLSAFISEDYIEDGSQRVLYYSKISEISSEEEKKEMLASLEDGFGPVSQEIVNLCDFALLRNMAGEFGVKRIVINKLEMMVELEKREDIIDQRLSSTFEKFGGKIAFDKFVKIKFAPSAQVADSMKRMLNFFSEALETSEE